MTPQALTIPAKDGYPLGATLYRPAASNGRAVQVQSAAGVKQEYYAGFAAYLAERGFTVLTFDYRGVGRSIQGHPRELKARMSDWALLDSAAAFSHLQQHSGQAKFLAVGHSFGGPAIAILPGNERLSAALAVGSQSCYWRHWPGATGLGMWILTHALLPAATRACGYFPGAVLRQGENLPAGVALEWASWCRDPAYLIGALGLAKEAGMFQAPFLLYSVADDIYAPLAAAKALLDLLPNGKPELRRIQPQALGVERIGHFGFFRERFRDSLWRDAADWLEAR
jgi:predicted alpha/beta hydrolase